MTIMAVRRITAVIVATVSLTVCGAAGIAWAQPTPAVRMGGVGSGESTDPSPV
ncbi:hypothetical protein [Streptomyces sioyaensis]|uniref:hypothetical protein n=1 Tax=Streptomyces sioyaensis TaxID=67364 RepID=UPI0036F158F5